MLRKTENPYMEISTHEKTLKVQEYNYVELSFGLDFLFRMDCSKNW